MYTQAYFENIRTVISDELRKAKETVYVAVAWFTDANLFSELLALCRKGLHIELIINRDFINNKSLIDYELLTKNKGYVYYNENETLMHNKFAIIDEKIVINGSYNWTNKAKYNHESITIVRDSEEFANDFMIEFQKLKNIITKSDKTDIIDFHSILIRLDAIKSLILLNDNETIEIQLKKLTTYLNTNNYEIEILIKEIKVALSKGTLEQAIMKIDAFTSKYRSIIVYVNHEVEAIKLEIQSLKFQISAIENEKIEIEKLIQKFQNEYNHRLGKIILYILEFEKKLLIHDENKYEEAKRNYYDFKETYDKEIEKKISKLSDEDEKELKEKFRKASKMCHPDLVSEDKKIEATSIFIKLKNAYDLNDLSAVRTILSQLENNQFTDRIIDSDKKENLKFELIRLRKLRVDLEKQITAIKVTDTFLLINSVGDWNQYFDEKQEELEKYYNDLKLSN